VRVTNPNLDGLAIQDLPHISAFRVRLSRHKPAASGLVGTARASTVLHTGDALLAVGTVRELDDFERLVGVRTDEDLTAEPGNVTMRRVVVTKKGVAATRLSDLHLGRRFGVQVTRVLRGDIELLPDPDLRVRLGDTLLIVGDDEATTNAAKALGDSVKALNETHFAAIFLGIAVGLAVGSIPLTLPGLPAPVKLGLAGGPLLIAILAGRFGRIGPVLWHVPASANMAIRELGITLFLACVGLKAGATFFETVFSPAGATWVAGALCIALIGPLVGGCLARRFLKLDYPTLSGVIAGSTTDPPALAFATGVCKGDHPAVAYATVYPLAMLLRIVLAQTIVLLMS
jgi:putative transport protein